ncbi:MAG: phosphoglycerate kinase [bacterium]|nr:phosphoglycerate kinase [bacterium]
MIKYLSKTNVKNLKGVAIARLDFNTEDDWRMKAAIPTLQLLLKHARALVILSHKGRPLGFQKQFSLRPDAEKLSGLLKHDITFDEKFNFDELRRNISTSPAKSIFVLENLRFVSMEKGNDKSFAKNLASLGDYFVNEAFAVSHRAEASVVGITKYLPSYAGLGLEKEIINLSRVMEKAKKPLIMIFGGAKSGDKLAVIKFFRKKADLFLIGGALANTLLYLKGTDIGTSLFDEDVNEMIKNLSSDESVILPVDFRRQGSKILDIGPQSEKLFASKIKDAKTIVWNGPMGLIEREEFKKGTLGLVRAIISNKTAFSVVGGGETVTMLKESGLSDKISFISTGGGAMLDFLAGKKLPGIEALK